jgi:hypothetical protein
LATRNRIHAVDRRDAGLNHLLGILARERIDRLALDVEVVLGEHWRTVVERLAAAVKHAAKHVLRHGHAQHVAAELDARVARIDARRALKHLNHCLGAVHFEHLTGTNGTIIETVKMKRGLPAVRSGEKLFSFSNRRYVM